MNLSKGSVRRVSWRALEKRCEDGNCGCVKVAGATHDDGEDVCFSTGPMLVEGVCAGVSSYMYVPGSACSTMSSSLAMATSVMVHAPPVDWLPPYK
jgi:hypothetical protein